MRPLKTHCDAPRPPEQVEPAPIAGLKLFQHGVIATAILMAVLVAIGVAHTFLAPDRRALTDLFFLEQDLPVIGPSIVLLAALVLRWRWTPSLAPSPDATWRTALLIAVAVIAAGWAGSYWVYDDFALSMDEFMARFDAQILAGGQLAARVPMEWRAYTKALQPLFMLDIPGHAYWVSNYLPLNAAFLGLGGKLGAQNLVPALWAGVAVAAVFGIARRLWPERPGAALVAAGLMAASPQVLITAMTPYAMSAHLALNLVWLWLFLKGGRTGHGLAAGVAFLATGLHQVIFHPLFATPFVLELWRARRWKAALWHTLAYALIGLFWAMYQPMLVHLYGATEVVAAAERHGAFATLQSLIERFDPAGLGYLAKNLIRFVTWQNVLLAPLTLLALAPAVRAGGVLRALVIGAGLTLGMLFILMPYQGHGWGYRYLHGLLGSFCLLAAWTWTRLSGPEDAARPAWRLRFGVGLASALALLLPLRAVQAHQFEHAYSMAVRQIQATDADVVIVDDYGVWFGVDLVRNTPSVDNRPIVMAARALTEAQTRAICSRFRVAWFDPDDAQASGIRRMPLPARPTDVKAGCPASRDRL